MGDSGTGTAEQHLRLIKSNLERRRLPTEVPCRTTVQPGAPLNFGVLDYLERTRAELAAVAAALAPDAGPSPRDDLRALAHFEASTAHLTGQQRFIRDTLLYRQGLERAIMAGDPTAIRRITCPACSCWGLFWQAQMRKAVCANRFCTRDRGGFHAAWTLGQLAQHVIGNKTSRPRTAT